MPDQSPNQGSLFTTPEPVATPIARDARAPLAARMRPQTLDEIVGQDHILGPGHAVRRSVEMDKVVSMIFWGPPGSGKTTIAEVIARTTRAYFVALSAVTAGVADLRRVVDEAERRRRGGQRTILFLDEIHRFNKSQQDSLLPHVERGTLTLIGATTENPSFEVNSALLSRCRVFTLHALSDAAITDIIQRALADSERGLGELAIAMDEDALAALATFANGDARMALTALELAAQVAPVEDGHPHITLAVLDDALQQRTLLYDRVGEEHYNLISALHKSVRGSDPDGAIYWLARMLEGGEDPLYIARRVVRMASEDIGLADPQGLVIAMAAQQAVHFVGMPEGALALTQAVVYLACAPKSNALERAYMAAVADIRATRNDPVPTYLRNAPTRLMRDLDYGQGYVYAHEVYATTGGDPADATRPWPANVQPGGYLPTSVREHRYYDPGATPMGAETSIARWLQRRYGGHTEDQD